MRHSAPGTLRVGMGQMRVDGGRAAVNLARAQQMVLEAGKAQCDVVVLPECLDLGWMHPSARTHAERIPGERTAVLGHAAATAGLWVVAGLTERTDTAVYNSAVLLNPQGELTLLHRKVNELAVARNVYTAGTAIEVSRTSFGTVGLPICADNFEDCHFISDAMADLGANVLLSPCAWAVTSEQDRNQEPYGSLWERSYAILAKRHGVAVVGVSNVGYMDAGAWQGRLCIGASLAVNPAGQVVGRGPYGCEAENLITVDLPLQTRTSRARGADTG